MNSLYSKTNRHSWLLLRLASLSLLLFHMSCGNLLKSLDSPDKTNDYQLLSAARDCFDQLDFDCAQYYYGLAEASTVTSIKDQAITESIFVSLHKVGVDLASLLEAFIDQKQDPGSAITSIANSISLKKANTLTTRNELMNNYIKTFQISDNSLITFNQFLLSISLFSEILSEASHTSGNLLQTDLVSDPSGCKSNVINCSVPTNALLTTTSTFPSIATYNLAAINILSVALNNPASYNMLAGALFLLQFTAGQVNSQTQFVQNLSVNLGSVNSSGSLDFTNNSNLEPFLYALMLASLGE